MNEIHKKLEIKREHPLRDRNLDPQIAVHTLLKSVMLYLMS